MQTHQLVSHESFAPEEVRSIGVRWCELADGRLMLRFRVDGCGSLAVPEFRGLGRGDDLWKTTCFELFLYDGEGRYRELNFSPSQQWAAYRFAGYRGNREDFEPVTAPEIHSDRGLSIFTLTAFVSCKELAGAQSAAVSAVIDEGNGQLSYWALAHNGPQPDFHDPACFRIPVAPAGAA